MKTKIEVLMIKSLVGKAIIYQCEAEQPTEAFAKALKEFPRGVIFAHRIGWITEGDAVIREA